MFVGRVQCVGFLYIVLIWHLSLSRRPAMKCTDCFFMEKKKKRRDFAFWHMDSTHQMIRCMLLLSRPSTAQHGHGLVVVHCLVIVFFFFCPDDKGKEQRGERAFLT